MLGDGFGRFIAIGAGRNIVAAAVAEGGNEAAVDHRVFTHSHQGDVDAACHAERGITVDGEGRQVVANSCRCVSHAHCAAAGRRDGLRAAGAGSAERELWLIDGD